MPPFQALVLAARMHACTVASAWRGEGALASLNTRMNRVRWTLVGLHNRTCGGWPYAWIVVPAMGLVHQHGSAKCSSLGVDAAAVLSERVDGARQDRKKVPAEEPVFALVAADLVEANEPVWHVSRFLPSVRCGACGIDVRTRGAWGRPRGCAQHAMRCLARACALQGKPLAAITEMRILFMAAK
jgi:hypothetical protein